MLGYPVMRRAVALLLLVRLVYMRRLRSARVQVLLVQLLSMPMAHTVSCSQQENSAIVSKSSWHMLSFPAVNTRQAAVAFQLAMVDNVVT